MAKASNLRVYAEADHGKRVFSVPAEDCQAIKMMLWRKGFKVSYKKNGDLADIRIR